MANELTKCKACGSDIAKGVKVCPNCGKDQRNFFMRHKFISTVLILIVLGIFGGALSGGDTETVSTNGNQSATQGQQSVEPEPKAPPMVVTVDNLISELDANALKASNTYDGQYVELTGELSNIDSSGGYFSLSPLNDEFSFNTVLCNISEEHLDTVENFTSNQQVTVTGTITSVGEVMGYTLEVETIK